jgi:hypothetical protein
MGHTISLWNDLKKGTWNDWIVGKSLQNFKRQSLNGILQSHHKTHGLAKSITTELTLIMAYDIRCSCMSSSSTTSNCESFLQYHLCHAVGEKRQEWVTTAIILHDIAKAHSADTVKNVLCIVGSVATPSLLSQPQSMWQQDSQTEAAIAGETVFKYRGLLTAVQHEVAD